MNEFYFTSAERTILSALLFACLFPATIMVILGIYNLIYDSITEIKDNARKKKEATQKEEARKGKIYKIVKYEYFASDVARIEVLNVTKTEVFTKSLLKEYKDMYKDNEDVEIGIIIDYD